MDALKLVLSKTRSCVQKYGMIQPCDKIAVGLSGGKDSVSMLYALARLSSFYPNEFSLCAITVDNGYKNASYEEMEQLCEVLGIEYRIVKTQIADIADKNDDPCAVCSRIRRRILCDTALEMGCCAIALAHTQDDAAQTVLLNLLYNGKIETFLPLTEYEAIKVIRPFYELPERLCSQLVESCHLPICKSLCPYDKKTQRQAVRQMIQEADRISRGANHRIMTAISKINKNE